MTNLPLPQGAIQGHAPFDERPSGDALPCGTTPGDAASHRGPEQARRALYLGGSRPLDGRGKTEHHRLSPEDLVTHGVIVGMTGSGKTGLLMVTCEEALLAGVPVVMLDLKGDLPNLRLAMPELSAAHFSPWLDERTSEGEREAEARAQAEAARARLAAWGLGEQDVRALSERCAVRVLTPGSTAGEPLHVLSFLEAPSPLWQSDVEAARESLSASVSLLLRLIGRDPEPTKSRDHVVLSVLAERRLTASQPADVASLLEDVRSPPIESIGAMPIDEYLPRKDRLSLATALNTLLASPTFEAWRMGTPLDVASWMRPRPDGRTPGVIVSVAHLDDDERSLVLGVVLEQLIAWMRTLPGAQRLRALVVIDEAFGLVPPHPAHPATKRPIITLLKQARAFGIGVLIATQNPMDLDYRVLSNAGLWAIGRLQTDADRQRLVDAMASESRTDLAQSPASLADTLKQLAPRWFLLRNVHRSPSVQLLQSRSTLCWLRGPMTRGDLKRLRGAR